MECTAVRDGDHYVVNGVKKWITNGCQSQYFVTAVRTGGEGMGGISLLLIDRDMGVETSQIKTSYDSSAGTAFVEYVNRRERSGKKRALEEEWEATEMCAVVVVAVSGCFWQ